MKKIKHYTVTEIALILLTTTQTVRNHINKGRLKAKQRGPNEPFLITHKAFENFLKQEKIPSSSKKKKKKKTATPIKKKKVKVMDRIKSLFRAPV